MVITVTLPAGGVLDLQGGLQSVHVVGVGDGLYGSAVQSTIGIDSHLAGGYPGTCLIETMIFILTFTSYPYFTPRWLEMTIRWTSEVPS